MAEQYSTTQSVRDRDDTSMPDPTAAVSRPSRLTRWIPILIAAIVMTMIIGLGIQSRNTARENPASTNQNPSRSQTDDSSATRANGVIPSER